MFRLFPWYFYLMSYSLRNSSDRTGVLFPCRQEQTDPWDHFDAWWRCHVPGGDLTMLPALQPAVAPKAGVERYRGEPFLQHLHLLSVHLHFEGDFSTRVLALSRMGSTLTARMLSLHLWAPRAAPSPPHHLQTHPRGPNILPATFLRDKKS